MDKSRLQKFAQLIAQKGGNVQPGQEVIVTAELDQPEFTMMVVEECYKLKAKKVEVIWTHQPLTALNVTYCDEETLGTLEKWQIEKLQHRVDTLPVSIFLLSEDPDGLNGIDQDKYSNALAKKMKIQKPYRDKMESRYQWSIAAVPGLKWAKKIFPNDTDEDAIEKMWELILKTSRADKDPIAQWNEHNENVHKRCDWINSLDLDSLHYVSSNGTDLTIGIADDTRFCGGSEPTLQGVYYNANIPSEEIFTSPDRLRTNGIVYSTMPLCYQGQIIDNFWLKFENGKVIDFHAEQNNDLLKKLLNMDENSSYLGECALVPYNSPIRESGILFYNTLFDENASCHLALGTSYPEVLKDFDKYTPEQLLNEKGMNTSIIHEDFMIGSKDLNITATLKDGTEVPIFINGNWAN